jgi:hypothetical protein
MSDCIHQMNYSKPPLGVRQPPLGFALDMVNDPSVYPSHSERLTRHLSKKWQKCSDDV